MINFDINDSFARLDVIERAVHISDIETERPVRVGVRGYGADFEEDFEVMTHHLLNVPVAYYATVTYDGEPILDYHIPVGYSYAQLIDERDNTCEDILCDDQDFFEWVWDEYANDEYWFLDYVVNGDTIPGLLDEKNRTCTLKDVLEHDGQRFDVTDLTHGE